SLSDHAPYGCSYTPMRENEFHLLNRTGWFSCPFVVLTPKSGRPAAAATMAPGAPRMLSAGISSRHPAPAPSRSAAYTALTLALSREIAIDTAAPPAKNGSADKRYMTLIRAMF